MPLLARHRFLLAGTKKGEDAQCSRVAAHGRLHSCQHWVTNGLLIRTGKGCSSPAPCLTLGLLLFCVLLSWLLTAGRQQIKHFLCGVSYNRPPFCGHGARHNWTHSTCWYGSSGTAPGFAFEVTCKERAFAGRWMSTSCWDERCRVGDAQDPRVLLRAGCR